MDLFLVARRCEEVRVERMADDGNEGSSRDESKRKVQGRAGQGRCEVQVVGWGAGKREGGRGEERESGVGGRAVQVDGG